MKTLLKKKNMSIKYNSLHIKTRYTLKIHVTTQQKQLKHTIHTYKRYFIIIPVDLYNLISNVYNKDFIYLTKKGGFPVAGSWKSFDQKKFENLFEDVKIYFLS